MMGYQRYKADSFVSRFMNIEDAEVFGVIEDLPNVTKNGPWLAGGALRRTLANQPLDSDFDFFFKTPEQFATFRDHLVMSGARKTSETEHHETFVITVNNKTRIVQCIKINFYDTPEALLDSFDFTITQFAYDGEDLICGEFALWDLARKRLALHKMSFGVSTMRRLLKYTKQGFTACSGVLSSILESVVNDPSIIHREVEYVD